MLVAAQQHFGAAQLEIVGIGVDNGDKLRQFAANYRVQYLVLVATVRTPELMRELGNNAAALPYSVLLNRERRITYRKLGAWHKSELEREIQAAIG